MYIVDYCDDTPISHQGQHHELVPELPVKEQYHQEPVTKNTTALSSYLD